MYLYDEVDRIDFLDQMLIFFLHSFVNLLVYWSTLVLCFVSPSPEVLTITMPSSVKCPLQSFFNLQHEKHWLQYYQMQHYTCYLTANYPRKCCFGRMTMRFLSVQINIVCSQHCAALRLRTRALNDRFSSVEIYGGISTCVSCMPRGSQWSYSKLTISKIKSSIRSCTLWDLYMQGTERCMISSSFQELVKLLSKSHLKKPFKTLR